MGVGALTGALTEQRVERSPKPRVVHVIDSLVRGGAETLLVNLLPDLSEHYDVVLVTLKPDLEFPREEIAAFELHCLDYRGFASIPACAWRLRRLISRHRPRLVRSQLYLSSIIARLATPASVPLAFSIHNPMSLDAYDRNRLALPLEKLTYRRRHHLISVSEDALDDFRRHVGLKGPTHLLPNFIKEAYVERARARGLPAEGPLRLAAVGILKEQKNYPYLLEALRRLPDQPLSVDIYGDGPLRTELQTLIDTHHLPVRLMGRRPDVWNVLGDYDLYVMPSSYEGFGIAPVEAMATGLPLLLSDLPVLHEVSRGNALFFDPADPDSLAVLLKELIARRIDTEPLSRDGIDIARDHYRKDAYLRRLLCIYDDVSGLVGSPADHD